VRSRRGDMDKQRPKPVITSELRYYNLPWDWAMFDQFGQCSHLREMISGVGKRSYQRCSARCSQRGSLFYGTEHSENTEQLCKSSLQCLISTSCTSLDRYMLVPLLLGSLCLERTGCANTRVEACVRLTLAITLTLTLKFQQYEYQHVGLLSSIQ